MSDTRGPYRIVCGGYPDLLDLLEHEPAPLPRAEAEVIEDAIRACGRDRHEFSVADVRPYYAAADIRPSRIGTTFSALVKRGVIVAVDVARSGNTVSRNGRKLVNLYRLADRGALK